MPRAGFEVVSGEEEEASFERGDASHEAAAPRTLWLRKLAVPAVLGVVATAALVAVLLARTPASLLRAAAEDIEEKALSASGQKEILDRHNQYRCMHGVQDLTWSDALAKSAQKWAQKTNGNMDHSSDQWRSDVGGFRYAGENLAWGATDAHAVDIWYDEIEFTQPKGVVTSFGAKTGHYTQVVWADTKSVGCGSYKKLLVCQYGPGGNMMGQFAEKVKPPSKSASACGAPQAPANIDAFLASLDGQTQVDCDDACKADGKGGSTGWRSSWGGGKTTTHCSCAKGGKVSVTCTGHPFESCTA